jgi:hypothetical protein
MVLVPYKPAMRLYLYKLIVRVLGLLSSYDSSMLVSMISFPA